jgi:hypothetical protein
MTQRVLRFVLCAALLSSLQLYAQEHYTEGAVWQVTTIHVMPGQMDTYLTSLRQTLKPLYDEAKKEGAIQDYKIFLKQTTSSPKDWDIAIAVLFPNFAALDGLTAKEEAIRDRISSKQAMQQVQQQRVQQREIMSTELVREIHLR